MAMKGPKTGSAKPAAPIGKASNAVPPKNVAQVPMIDAGHVPAAFDTPSADVSDAAVAAVLAADAPKTSPDAAPVPDIAAQSAAKTQADAIAPAAAVAETTAKVADSVNEMQTETTQAVSAAAQEAATMQTEMTNEMKNVTENTAAKTQAMFGDMNDRAKGMMEKNAKIAEEMNELTKGNIEAVVESSRIAAKGFESMGQDAAEYSRKSFEHATAAMKNMAAVKSPTELFKLQSDFMRSAFDMYVSEASKTTEQMMKLAGDAAQPLSNRMAVAADKVKQVA